MNFKLIYIIFFISNIYCTVFEGHIYDYYSQPKSNALIIIKGNGKEYKNLSNLNGFFKFDNFDPGNYSIEVSHIGYLSYSSTLIIENESFLDIYLKEENIPLEKTVVTGTRSIRHIKDSPTLTHIISKNDINNSAYGTVKEMLELAMPNVQMVASNHGDERVKFQGLDNKYMTFLIDGDRVSGEFAGNIDFSMFNLNNTEKIEVVEGAMSVLYGSTALGGVVNIITKKPTNPFWFDISFLKDDPMLNSESVEFGFNKNNFSYTLNLSNQYSDGYDLSSQSEFSKTLEEFKNESILNKFRYNFSNSRIEYSNKRYKSRVIDYASVFNINTFQNQIIFDSPLIQYRDFTDKIKISHEFDNNSHFKIVFLKERYIKKYYYPYYYNQPYDFTEQGEIFNQGILTKNEIVAHFNYETKNNKRIIGFEYSEDFYESFNIYDFDGNILFESIFDGLNIIKKRYNSSFFYFDEINIQNNELCYGIRFSNNDNISTSLTYLLKNRKKFNTRFSYSSGYRLPSLKELYYEWVDHEPNIFGNSSLQPTTNHYFSISFDKKTNNNDFSIMMYYNDIKNMISTEYQSEGLFYKNYDEVILYGYNLHYSRKVNQFSNFRLVYNYTVPNSKSDEILEGISKHAFRINFVNEIIENKLKLVLNVKYGGEKFNFDQEQDYIGNSGIKKLDDYILVDLIFASKINDSINLKYGVKNISDYKDETRNNSVGSSILNNYDPGRRIFIEFNLSLMK